MKKYALFIFFCLLSCKEIGPYRDIQVTILNDDYADVYVYSIPDSSIVTYVEWDAEYAKPDIHFGNLPDGLYYIESQATKGMKRSPAFEYKGVYQCIFKY